MALRDRAAPRVLAIVGTRPEAIKMAPVVAALRAGGEAETRVALTGQHTTLVDQVVRDLGLEPDYELAIMREDQSLYDVAHGCLDGLRDVAADFSPDALLVQGDTASVLFGALVGFFENIPIGHVEAGLRSGRPRSPFPEEMFRRLTDTLADWRFAPTPRAAAQLLAEGCPPGSVHVTGNTVVDSLHAISGKLRHARSPALAEALASGRRLVLLTVHRRESFGAPLERVFAAVRALADAEPEVVVLFPVHPNPNVLGPARALLSDHPRVLLTEPLDYADLVVALREAALVLTDSGGIQEEAPTFGTPVIVLREVTERPEGVLAGVADLVGTDTDALLARARARLAEPPAERGTRASPYGDGRAGERIADIVLAHLLGRPRRTADWAP